eukprot:CAMPEP_0170538874 /NCGR_PEP_ID=MMETSP0209-20121228/103579_1 /TAXON_ID=665100 ORGANISM="Litonotus pictus, Strain P1" /NCGR_SAMPLE_ID=MMETSP0209 /ASSEMBLY_ACC=CAM_ASM_000301 /LENGTH=957 /DNA_ID=CAMNT_0010840665 /DNA_START=605 /DNA_END=3475 /DNA_ORIENTATION=-
MVSWKERCEKNQKYLREKIYSKQDIILGAINKLSKEKTASIEIMKNEIIERHGQFDTFINFKETTFIKLLSMVSDDSKALYKHVENSTQTSQSLSQSKSTIKDKEISELTAQYLNLNWTKEKQKQASQYVIEMDEEIKKMKELIYKNMLNISIIFANFYTVKKELGDLLNSFPKYETGIRKTEEDFDYLSNPTVFPEAYKQSIGEVRRRLLFNKEMMSIIERMHEILNKENENRKKFIDHFGKYLTNDYIPSLKFVSLKLNIDFYNNKELCELPNVLNDVDEEELKRFNSALSGLEVKILNGVGKEKGESDENNSNSNNNSVGKELHKVNLTMPNNTNTELIKSDSETHCISKSAGVSPQITPLTNSKDTDLNMKSFEEVLRLQKIKCAEIEQKLLFKEQEIKRLTERISEKDKKITELSVDTEKFFSEIDKLNNNYVKQLTLKDQRISEKNKENDSLLKQLSDNDSKKMKCVMCLDQVKNSIEYESWNTYVYSLNDTLMKNNVLIKEIENSNKDMACRMNFIKKHYFQYLMNSTNVKNIEIKKIKEECDLKMLELEDHFKKQKEKYEEEFKLKTTFIEKSVNEINREVTKLRKEVEVRTQINSKFSSELAELKESNSKLVEDNENLIKERDGIMVERKELEDKLEKMENESTLFSPIKDKLEQEIAELKDNIVNIKRQNNKTCTELKAEILKYSELCESQEKSISEKIESYDKIKLEHSELEDTVEKFRNLKNTELQSIKTLSSVLEKENLDLKKKIEDLEHSLSNANEELSKFFSTGTNVNNQTDKEKDTINNTNNKVSNNFSKKPGTNIFEVSEIVKVSHDNFFLDHSTTKLGSTDNNCLTNINLTNLTKMVELEEYINIKRIEKGNRAIFIPFCEGVYVPISLCSNEEETKMYYCNYILNINSFDKGLQEVINENSLLIIGKISKISEYDAETHGEIGVNDNKFSVVDLEKLE